MEKNEIMPFAATWVYLEIIILNEIRQKKTKIIQCHLYVESKRKKKKLFTKQKQTHRNRKQFYGYQRGEQGGEVGRDKLEGWD